MSDGPLFLFFFSILFFILPLRYFFITSFYSTNYSTCLTVPVAVATVSIVASVSGPTFLTLPSRPGSRLFDVGSRHDAFAPFSYRLR
jgi:hypothetical protein